MLKRRWPNEMKSLKFNATLCLKENIIFKNWLVMQSLNLKFVFEI